jgi:4-hydroxybenzoate polyprenyltransferase
MNEPIPLCVDPEGTLFGTDTVMESAILLVKRKPWLIYRLVIWRLQGRSVLRRKLVSEVSLDFAALPTHPEFENFLKHEHDRGRKIFLVTDSDSGTAAAMAKPFACFEGVIGQEAAPAGNNGGSNGSPREGGLAAALQARFGGKQFDYATRGSDGKIQAAARKTILVTDSDRVIGTAKEAGEVERIFPPVRGRAADWLRTLRVYQWAKNLLLVAPLAFAHGWTDMARWKQLLPALAAFCLCASSVYILNDLIDLESDRHHPRKRHRPFAAGTVPLMAGVVGGPLLFLASLAIAAGLPWPFVGAFLLYFAATFAYSLRLKQVAILDVLVLAGLYSLRVIAGGFAAQTTISDWLLAFSMFLFLSLAFVKRFSELQMAKFANREALKGRGYVTSDIELVSSMGVGCGYLSVLVLAFYINNPDVVRLYHRPAALWLACPVLLYWVSRIWLLAHRKILHDDPIVFTLTDKQSWLIGVIIVLIAAAASPA